MKILCSADPLRGEVVHKAQPSYDCRHDVPITAQTRDSHAPWGDVTAVGSLRRADRLVIVTGYFEAMPSSGSDGTGRRGLRRGRLTWPTGCCGPSGRPGKAATYECGVDPVGEGWAQNHIRYYVYAYLYVIFAVDAVYLFPWATVFARRIRRHNAVEMFVFLGFLAIGMLYAWKKGVLRGLT